MALLPDPVVHDFLGVQRNFDALTRRFVVGRGDPNGVVRASPPAFFLREDGAAGSYVYVKTTPPSDLTGWVVVA